MKNLTRIGFLLISFSLFIATSCKKDDDKDTDPTPSTGKFTMEFSHNFNGDSFTLNQEYTSSLGEKLELSKVRYYISNVKLEKADGTVWTEENSYHLVEGDDAATMKISFADVPVGEYQSISYMIGVDSLHNVSGTQEGALDPANNMFWSWNNGYIFFKIEGYSSASTSNSFAYHVGGFAGANNAITTNTHSMADHTLKINGTDTPQLHFEVDLNKAFDGSTKIKIADLNGIHMPGQMAVHMAHNFKAAFSLSHTH